MITVFSYRHRANSEVKSSMFYKQSWKALSCVVYDDNEMVAYFSMNRKDEIAECAKAGCEIMDIWFKSSLTNEQIRQILTYIIQIIRLWSPRHPKLFNYLWFKKTVNNAHYAIEFLNNYELGDVKEYDNKIVSKFIR